MFNPMHGQEHDQQTAVRRLRWGGIGAFLVALFAVAAFGLVGTFDNGPIGMGFFFLGRFGLFVVMIICGIQLLIRARRRDFTIGGRQHRILFWIGAAFAAAQVISPLIAMTGTLQGALGNTIYGLIFGLAAIALLNANVDPTHAPPRK